MSSAIVPSLLALIPDWLDPERIIATAGVVGIIAIVFAESGLLIGFFLPGDALLFTAGMASAGIFGANLHFNIVVLTIGCLIAAVVGDQVGYLFGKRVGPSIFKRPDSRLFKHENVEKAQEFFDEYGPKAIVMARFVPVIRTFTPIIAGVGRMEYSTFVRYNVIGGVVWAVGVTLLGYFLGGVGAVKDNFEIAILLVVVVSVVPIALEVLKARREKADQPG